MLDKWMEDATQERRRACEPPCGPLDECPTDSSACADAQAWKEWEELLKSAKMALSAMETPDDLTPSEREYVIEDLALALKRVEE